MLARFRIIHYLCNVITELTQDNFEYEEVLFSNNKK